MGLVKERIPQGIKNIYHIFVAILANIFYRFPSRKLTVIGVTGTDGKTTTASLIYAIIKEAGYNVGLVTSISAKIGDREEDTGFHVTSPDPGKLQRFLKKMVAAGCEYAVLEVTSHGLDQHRFLGVNFKVGVLTNISYEHLDYHKTFKNYVKAKAKLFGKVKYSILNADDPSIRDISKVASGEIIRYGINTKADIKVQGIETVNFCQTIYLKDYKIKTKLGGDYNVYNILAAVAVANALDISQGPIISAIEKFTPLHGRFEIINRGQNFSVVVDFAHTPKALEAVLKLCREILDMGPISTSDVSKGAVIVVFGCAGLRDYKKRPKMGEIACKMADIAVLTAEDPRTENVNDIIEQISQGCFEAGGEENKTFFKIPDRQEAIKFALKKLAKRGDLVIITGKGHEKSMCYGKVEYPWSDQKVVLEALMEEKSNAP